jgi:hypothetical protein
MGLWADLRGQGPAIDHARFVVMRIKGGRMAPLLPAETTRCSLYTRTSKHQKEQVPSTPSVTGPTNSHSDGAAPVHALEAGRLRPLTDC